VNGDAAPAAPAAPDARGRSTSCTVGNWLPALAGPTAVDAVDGAAAGDPVDGDRRSKIWTLTSWRSPGGRREDLTCAWACAPAAGDADTCDVVVSLGGR
jgi:hypothetical protein